jgi:uncharacterized protein
MSDPFEALRRPVAAVDPDPIFAARLRARVERALALPEGVTVSDLTLESDQPSSSSSATATPTAAPAATATASGSPETPVDPVLQGDVGYVSLWVPDVDRATVFFAAVLGWTYGPQFDGHARLLTGMDLPQGVHGGHEHSTLFLCYVIDDMEEALERVRGAGGRAEDATLEPHGLTTMCTDIEGTPFAVYEPPSGPRAARLPATGRRHGDLSYITMEVQDSVAVRHFYGRVLGWHFSTGHVEDGWGIDEVVPKSGLHGGHAVTTVLPMYRVDDIETAVVRVRAAGGSATDPEGRPYGVTSECVDDQGTRFYLGQL